MAKGAKVYGNLLVSKERNVITLHLNRADDGRAYALFTEGEIPGLIAFLKQFQAAPPSDEDWRDLI